MGRCDPGLKHADELTVADGDTAVALGSGDIPVVGTTALLALAERACVDAVRDDLAEGETSVGSWAEVDHLLPVAVGETVRARAILTGHHGRRLEFTVMVEHGDQLVAKVRHRRVLVERERYLAKVTAA